MPSPSSSDEGRAQLEALVPFAVLTILTTLLVAGKTTTLLEGLSYYVVPETEAERASCSSVLAFVMGEEDMDVDAEVRTVGVDELAEWLTAQGVGVQPLTLTVPVLDARVIESIRGLDT